MTRGKRKKPPVREVANERLGVEEKPPEQAPAGEAPPPESAPASASGFSLPADAGLPVGNSPATAEAAAAALQPEPVATKPDPLDGAPRGKPGRPPAGTPAPGQWSRNKIKDAKRAELSRRVIELQDQVAAMQPPDAPHALGEPPTAPVEELKETLGYMLPGISAALKYGVGPEFELTDEEQKVIAANAVAPLAPHYGAVRTRVPWVPLLLVVGSMAFGKWMAYAERKKAEAAARKLADAEPVDTMPSKEPANGVPPGRATVVDARVAEKMGKRAPETGQGVRSTMTRPFGGPDE